jgi:hypothetical protein
MLLHVTSRGTGQRTRSGPLASSFAEAARKEHEIAADYVRRFLRWHAAADFRSLFTAVSLRLE